MLHPSVGLLGNRGGGIQRQTYYRYQRDNHQTERNNESVYPCMNRSGIFADTIRLKSPNKPKGYDTVDYRDKGIRDSFNTRYDPQSNEQQHRRSHGYNKRVSRLIFFVKYFEVLGEKI